MQKKYEHDKLLGVKKIKTKFAPDRPPTVKSILIKFVTSGKSTVLKFVRSTACLALHYDTERTRKLDSGPF